MNGHLSDLTGHINATQDTGEPECDTKYLNKVYLVSRSHNKYNTEIDTKHI